MGVDEADAFDTTLLAESGPRSTSKPPSSDATRWVGQRLDHFDVQRPLGSGGMGAVYVGHDRSLDRRVAIKVLPEGLAESGELQERFLREARAQARLNSAHVAHIYYIGRTPANDHGKTSLFFAMELVDGGDLEDFIDKREPVDPELARRLMLEVAQGLRDAQRAGIIHRDIKPSNLLLDKKGNLKIADFGVAKPVGGTDSKITRDGAVVGSPLYMAPEQAKGEDIDHRADMYSVGCTFYHLLSGAPPFNAKTPVAVIAKHLTEAPPRLALAVPIVPKRLAAIVERLMSKEPAGRFDSYDDLIAALEAAAPETVRHAGFWVRGAAVGVDVGLASLVIGLLGLPGLFLHLIYVSVAHATRGQSLGKLLMNLQVRRPDGGRLGLGRSAVRTVASMWMPFFAGLVILLTQGRGGLQLAIRQIQITDMDAFRGLVLAVVLGNALLSLLYGAGLALAAFHPEKRAAHDLIVGSEVVYRLK
ncbi:MAG: protein kinase [Myxococcales bacterium]|nr:protein kinase [Myxococcales bacterium]